MKKKTLEYFIKEATAVHSSRYQYANTIYHGMSKKLNITCPMHGDFEQLASDHLAGRGCRHCNERQSLTLDIFKERAAITHHNKYTYDCVKYVNVTTKVEITCPKHGSFLQTPKDHLQKYGCPSCGGTKKITYEDFVRRANKKHAGMYTYEKASIRSMNENVDITCPIHGIFSQRPADHVNGAGCPECSLFTRGRYSEKFFETFPDQCSSPAILYLVTVSDEFCKIGVSKNTVAQRFGNKRVEVVDQLYTTLKQAYDQEQLILAKLASHRFRAVGLTSRQFAGWTECFPLSLLSVLKAEFHIINITNTSKATQ